jgi:hypothetical protein
MKRARLFCCFLLSVLFVAQSFALTVYRSVDKKGVVTYSDKPVSSNHDTKEISLSQSRTSFYDNVPAPTIDPVKEAKKANLLKKQRDARKQLSRSYRRLHVAKKRVKDSIAALQLAKEKLANISPSFDNQIKLQQAQVAIDQQNVTSAKTALALAQDTVLQAENHYNAVRLQK